MDIPPANIRNARSSRSRSEPGGGGDSLVWVFLAFAGSMVLLILVLCGVGGVMFVMQVSRKVRDEVAAENRRQAEMPFDEQHQNLRRPDFGDNPALTPIKDLPGFIARNLKPNDHAGPLAPTSALWNKLQAGRGFEGQPQGGGGNNPRFRDAVPGNGLLIGVFACAPNNDLVHFIQPIYLTAQGERVGAPYGKADDYVVCLKAKKGYAVGAIDTHFGAAFDSVKLTFMKVKADGLDPNDFYQSIQIGGDGGGPGRLGGDGTFVVGLHGTTNANDGFTPAGTIGSLGILSLK